MFKRGYVFIYYFILFLFPLLFFACSSSNSTSSVGTIYEDSDPNVVVTGINLASNYIELSKTKDTVLYYDISAVAEPSNALNKKLLYSSSDHNIATVDESGVLTITDFGEFTVEVKSAANNGIWQKIDFYVAEKILTSVDVNSIPLSIFGDYNVNQYGINNTPDTNIFGSLTINANKNNSEVVTLGLVFNGAVINMTVASEGMSELSYEAIAQSLIEQLDIQEHADSSADIIISLKGQDYPELVNNGIIKNNEVLKLALKKESDINAGQDLVSKPVVNATTIDVGESREYDIADVSTFRVSPTVSPSNTSNLGIIYHSSNEEIATVNALGDVLMLKEGQVEITATSLSGSGVSDTLLLNVLDSSIKVTSINRNTNDTNVLIDETIDVSGRVVPETASFPTIIYSSSNPNIASVDSTTGIVTGKNVGQAVITATTDGGRFKQDYVINVSAFSFPVTGIMNLPAELYINKETPVSIKPAAFPNYAFNKELSYSITGDDIISFDEATGSIQGLKAGEASIKVTSVDNADISKTLKIYVRDQVQEIDVSSINITSTPPANLYIGHTTGQLTAEPNNDANINTNLFAESYDSNIVSIYAKDGAVNTWELSPINEGRTTIRVFAKNGVEQTFEVNVHKVMNVQGGYKVNSVEYTYNGIKRTFYPAADAVVKDNLQGEFGINVNNSAIVLKGRLQFTPENPLQKTSYTFNNWRFLFINKEITLDNNDVYAKQTKEGYKRENINITGEKTIEYLYTNNGLQARIFLEKVTDTILDVPDKTIFVTPLNMVSDPHSAEGYYEMTWFYGNPSTVDRPSSNPVRYQPLFSDKPEDRPTTSDLGISYLTNNQKCWFTSCLGGNGTNGSVTNYTGSFVIKVDGVDSSASLTSIFKVQKQGHNDFDLNSWRKYIHATYSPISIRQDTGHSGNIVSKSVTAGIVSNSRNEGSKGAYIAYTPREGNVMQFETQFMGTYQFMYRARKVSDRYIDLPTTKYVDGDVSGRTAPTVPAQAEVLDIQLQPSSNVTNIL